MYRKSCVGGLITEPGPQRGALRQLSLRLEVRFTVLKELAGVRNGANNRKDVGTWNFRRACRNDWASKFCGAWRNPLPTHMSQSVAKSGYVCSPRLYMNKHRATGATARGPISLWTVGCFNIKSKEFAPFSTHHPLHLTH